MVARNVGGKDHRLKLHLAGKLDPAKCASKVKPNKIVLTLRKAAADKWEHLTDKDKQAALAKKPKVDRHPPPSSSTCTRHAGTPYGCPSPCSQLLSGCQTRLSSD
jgi:hypothetical protein